MRSIIWAIIIIIVLGLGIWFIFVTPDTDNGTDNGNGNSNGEIPNGSDNGDFTGEVKTYSGDSYTVEYPANWNIEPTANFVLFAAPFSAPGTDPFSENVIIQVEEFQDNPPSLNEVATIIATQLQTQHPDLEVEEGDEITIGGAPGHRAVVDVQVNDFALKQMLAWTIHGNNVYIITYSAEPDQYSSYLDEAQHILNSISFPGST